MDKVVANNPALFRAYMKQIPTVDLKFCEYDKSRRVLKMASEYFGMPREFYVRSHHTGKTVRFTVVGPEDTLFDQDQWDGEQQVYRPQGHVPGVDHMVIYHAWQRNQNEQPTQTTLQCQVESKISKLEHVSACPVTAATI